MNIKLDGHKSSIVIELTNLSSERALLLAETINNMLKFASESDDIVLYAKKLVTKYPDSKLSAVKELKEKFDLGLKEAKDYIDVEYNLINNY